MCLILKQAITPLCAPRTLPLCILRHWLYPYSPLCTEASDFTLMCPLTLKLTIIPLFTLMYVCLNSSGCARKHGGGTRKRLMNKILITMSDHESEFRVEKP